MVENKPDQSSLTFWKHSLSHCLESGSLWGLGDVEGGVSRGLLPPPAQARWEPLCRRKCLQVSCFLGAGRGLQVLCWLMSLSPVGRGSQQTGAPAGVPQPHLTQLSKPF